MLTNSQEEQLLHELAMDSNMKEISNHLELDPYSSFSNLEFAQNSFLQSYDEQDASLPVDSKMSLQQQLVLVEQPQQPQQQYLHQSQYVIPQQLPTPIHAKEEFAGDYNFQLILNDQNLNKHWVYSQKLQKVFIHMEEVLPLQFSWAPPQDGLWVRATMVYKLDQHRSQPVIRCPNHMAPDNNSNRNINPLQVKHVIRCTHSASTYEEAANGHLSVLTPLGIPEAGVSYVPMDFTFYCKNSCTSGMNRRPTELIFTLESQQNQILGRRKLELRVCSCPKRDKEKEEGETSSRDATVSVGSGSKKRKMVNVPGAPPPGKKLLTENSKENSKVFRLDLKIVGRDNYNSILKYAHDCMAGSAYRSNNHDLYKPYMDDVLKKFINSG
ncbi:cellular tumor antigen p53 [Phymastichus coffea]|uniref:cellular tumor antigen p53 n=1 Tax=Phymastichus coffea TaxID=108790 RepID=UPI00273C944C|nr:cellular tumor antigen p53 [Phymastichus coffea]